MANDKARPVDPNAASAVKAVAWNPAAGDSADGDQPLKAPQAPGGMPMGMLPPGLMGMGPGGAGIPPWAPWMPGAPGMGGGAPDPSAPVNEPSQHLKNTLEKQNNFMNGVVTASKIALDDLRAGVPGRVADPGFFQGPDADLMSRLTKGKSGD